VAIDGRLLIATTRSTSRPQSDLATDYRLAWWSNRGRQSIGLPGDEAGIVDAAARPGGGAIAAIVAGSRVLSSSEDGTSPTDLMPALPGVQPGNPSAYLSLSWAGPDKLLVRQTAPGGITLLDLAQRSQTPLAINGLAPMLSTDGQHLAFAFAGNASFFSIYVVDQPFTSQSMRKLTADSVLESNPAWSTDGAWIAYAAETAASPAVAWELRAVRVDGTNESTVVPAQTGVSYSSLRWSPDGRAIGFTEYVETAHTRRIGVVNRDGSDMHLLSDNTANDKLLDWRP